MHIYFTVGFLPKLHFLGGGSQNIGQHTFDGKGRTISWGAGGKGLGGGVGS